MPKKKTTPAKKTAKKSTPKAVKKKAVKPAAAKKPAKKAASKPAKKAAKKTSSKPAGKAAKKQATKKAKKAVKKQAPKAAKKAVKKTVKKAAKKTVKKVAADKALKQSTAKPTPGTVKKKTRKQKVAPKTGSKKKTTLKQKAPQNIRVGGPATSNGGRPAKSTPIVFSLEDVEELMASKNNTSEKTPEKKPAKKAAKQTAPAPQPKKVLVEDEPVQQRVLGAASLADILGFNPAEKKKRTDLSSDEVPKKWKKYYRLLVELRAHLRDEINLHSSDTLKHSSREDSGDLSGYGSHQADAGTESFDRDFALSLVSSEQDALNEIEEAILRIKDGSYGYCEVTGKAIPAARLTAVPFARFSVEGQAEHEKNLRRKKDRSGTTGLFGDVSDVPKLTSDDEDE